MHAARKDPLIPMLFTCLKGYGPSLFARDATAGLIVAVIASAINFLAFFMAWKNGSLIVDGVLQAPFVNLLCAVMFAVLGIVGLLRKAADNRETEEE